MDISPNSEDVIKYICDNMSWIHPVLSMQQVVLSCLVHKYEFYGNTAMWCPENIGGGNHHDLVG
jgi:hypothetical protein